MTQEIYAWRTPRDLVAQEIEPQGLHLRSRTWLAERVLANEDARSRNRSTHCIHGHPLRGKNLATYYYDGKAKRFCIACRNERNRAQRVKMNAKKPAAVAAKARKAAA